MLFLIRHALTAIEPDAPSEGWALDPAGTDALEQFARGYDWDRVAYWFASTEPKAVKTAQALTDRPVTTLDGLRELRRPWADDYETCVARMLTTPQTPAAPGWETGDAALSRFDLAMRECAGSAGGHDFAVVAHGLVMSLWRQSLRRAPLRLDEWRGLRFPDLLILDDDDLHSWLSGSDRALELYPPA